MFNPHTPAYRAEMLKKWYAAKLTGRSQVEADAHQVIKFRPLYAPVEAQTGVPWWMVGCFDCREEGFNHHKALVNGDPLDRPTVHVPHGVGPFLTWSEGAVFAMKYDHLDGQQLDLLGWLIEAERYNGEGYHLHSNPVAPSTPEPSPYIWSGTSIYVRGKYRFDGEWDPNLVDAQSGVAAIMQALIGLGVDLGVQMPGGFPLTA